ncbi:hypothetical protein DRN69_09385, partial [Candidatus Pacearchaeota archaeon]
IKEKLTQDIIQKHLGGIITIGCFQINPINNKVKWICFDFDGDLKEEFKKSKKLFLKLKEKGFNPLLEFSGRRGYHIWLFLEPTDAATARKFAMEIAKESEPHEIFPKQDKLEESKKYGCQVKLPLGLHRVSRKWSYFFDENFSPLNLTKSRELLLKFCNNKDSINL